VGQGPPAAADDGALHLITAGLVTGCATAVSGPGQRALLSDISDGLGTAVATKMLAWQDFAHRITMILAPPLAGWAVTVGGPLPLLWAEAAGVGVAAAVLLTVRGVATSPPENPPSLRHVLVGHRDIRLAVVMSGVGGLVWFAFTLGLAILGVQTGQPGVLIAAGMTGYGIGSLTGALLAPILAPRLPELITMATGWAVLGLAFAALPMVTASPTAVGGVALVGGFAMPLGIGALNRLITTRTDGADRRAAFAAESLVHDGAVSIGLLAGGAVIGLVGAGVTLVAAGVLQLATALVVGPWSAIRQDPAQRLQRRAVAVVRRGGVADDQAVLGGHGGRGVPEGGEPVQGDGLPGSSLDDGTLGAGRQAQHRVQAGGDAGRHDVRGERGDEAVTAGAVALAHTANVPVVVARVDEVGEGELVQHA